MGQRHDERPTSARRWFSLKKLGFFTIIYTVALLPGIGCSMTGSETTRGPLVGGPCEYRSYPGQAEIVSVAPLEAPAVAALQRIFSLLPDREMPPDRALIEKFDIRPGKRLGCTLKVITRGTCTPILFDFPSLAPGDAAPR
jgi:hypothetical protein